MIFNKNPIKTVLIFEHSLTGHRFEYINHLYNAAVLYPSIDFFFALPKTFSEFKSKHNLKSYPNIKLIIIDDIFEYKNLFFRSFFLTKSLKKIVIKYNITDIFLPSFISYLPFLPIMLHKSNVSGIIYSVYLYRWKESRFIKKLKYVLIYSILSKFKMFKNIFLLNDRISSKYLNHKYNTGKFSFLPDPFNNISTKNTSNLRDKFNINENAVVFLHFGALSERKGTLEILKAIKLMDENTLKNKCFIFAGAVNENIKQEFHMLIKELNTRTQILCFDKFCNYSFISSLCLSSNYLLIPYKETSQSSGVIGYASKFNIPVIAPNEKLIGKLIKQYELGYTIAKADAYHIANFIINICSIKNKEIPKTYIKANTIQYFTDIIFTKLLT